MKMTALLTNSDIDITTDGPLDDRLILVYDAEKVAFDLLNVGIDPKTLCILDLKIAYENGIVKNPLYWTVKAGYNRESGLDTGILTPLVNLGVLKIDDLRQFTLHRDRLLDYYHKLYRILIKNQDQLIQNVRMTKSSITMAEISYNGIPLSEDRVVKFQNISEHQLDYIEYTYSDITLYKTRHNLNSVWKDGMDAKALSKLGIPAVDAYLRAIRDRTAYKAIQSLPEPNIQHPTYCPWGTSTSRNAAKAKTFIPALGSWLRPLIEPPQGYVIHEHDYKSQEWLITALLAKDERMLDYYKSGDPYTLLQQDLKLKSRDESKQSAMVMLYSGSLESCPSKFKGLRALKQYNKRCYLQDKVQSLPSGWNCIPKAYSDFNQYNNFMSQGLGAEILRRICNRLHKSGIRIVYPLHDSVCILSKESELDNDILKVRNIMANSANEILNTDLTLIGDPDIIRHGDVWNYKDGAAKFAQVINSHQNFR